MFMIGQQRIVRNAPDGGTGGTGGEGGEGGTGGAAHPVAAPWEGAEGVWNVGEGENAKPWYATIPEEGARQHIEAKGYKTPAELALANYNLTKLQRGDPTVIGLPGDDATPEQMSEFYERLGRPAEPAGYEFKFDEGVKVDDSMLEFGRSAFHEAGLTPKQAQIVADKWNEFAASKTEELQGQTAQQNDAELDALKSAWGEDLDKNKAAGQRAMQALGIKPELVEKIEQNIGSAAIVELLATIGRKSDEGGFTNSDQGGDPNNPETMSKEQAAAKITALQGDAEFQKKYTDRNHPGHKDAVEFMQRLFARA